MDNRVAQLSQLYSQIYDFAVVRDRGQTPLRPRQMVEAVLKSRVVLLGQGLAQSAQRVTGLPYRTVNGLSPAGRRLDSFLKPLGHTIDHTEAGRIYAYSTDLIPWYPGKRPSGKGDLRPTHEQLELCWGWFERECDLVKPQAIMLLGKWPAQCFLRRYSPTKLSQPRFVDVSGAVFEASVHGHDLVAVPTYHPSAIWGRFEEAGRRSWEFAAAALRPIVMPDCTAVSSAPGLPARVTLRNASASRGAEPPSPKATR